MESLVGQTFAHYRIAGLLGTGGMGSVYEAEDADLGRHVDRSNVDHVSDVGHCRICRDALNERFVRVNRNHRVACLAKRAQCLVPELPPIARCADDGHGLHAASLSPAVAVDVGIRLYNCARCAAQPSR